MTLDLRTGLPDDPIPMTSPMVLISQKTLQAAIRALKLHREEYCHIHPTSLDEELEAALSAPIQQEPSAQPDGALEKVLREAAQQSQITYGQFHWADVAVAVQRWFAGAQPVELPPLPELGMSWFCNKCGQSGAGQGGRHHKPFGPPCDYLPATLPNTTYSADQIHARDKLILAALTVEPAPELPLTCPMQSRSYCALFSTEKERAWMKRAAEDEEKYGEFLPIGALHAPEPAPKLEIAHSASAGDESSTAGEVCEAFDVEYARAYNEFANIGEVGIAWHFWRVATEQADKRYTKPSGELDQGRD